MGNGADVSVDRWVFSECSQFPRPYIPLLLHLHFSSSSPALTTSISRLSGLQFCRADVTATLLSTGCYSNFVVSGLPLQGGRIWVVVWELRRCIIVRPADARPPLCPAGGALAGGKGCNPYSSRAPRRRRRDAQDSGQARPLPWPAVRQDPLCVAGHLRAGRRALLYRGVPARLTSLAPVDSPDTEYFRIQMRNRRPHRKTPYARAAEHYKRRTPRQPGTLPIGNLPTARNSQSHTRPAYLQERSTETDYKDDQPSARKYRLPTRDRSTGPRPPVIFSTFEAEKRGSYKGDIVTRIKCAIATKRKILNWSVVFSSLLGAAVAQLLDSRLPPRRTRLKSRPDCFRIFACGNRAGRCRWSAGIFFFSGNSRLSRPSIPALLHTHLVSPSSALNTSLLRAAYIFSLGDYYESIRYVDFIRKLRSIVGNLKSHFCEQPEKKARKPAIKNATWVHKEEVQARFSHEKTLPEAVNNGRTYPSPWFLGLLPRRQNTSLPLLRWPISGALFDISGPVYWSVGRNCLSQGVVAITLVRWFNVYGAKGLVDSENVREGTWRESRMACSEQPSQHSLGVISGNHVKTKLGWQDRRSPQSRAVQSERAWLHVYEAANGELTPAPVSREQRRNEGEGQTGDPREGPPTSGIVRHDSHTRKSGSDPAGNRARFAWMGGRDNFASSLTCKVDSTALCTPEPQMFVHWLLPQCCLSPGSKGFATCFLASLVLAQRRPGPLRTKVDPRILLKLRSVVMQLDPRFSSDPDILLDEKPFGGGNQSLLRYRDSADVCGEEFRGAKHGFPYYQEGFVLSPSCDFKKRRPVNELVTVLINFSGEESLDVNRLEVVLQGARGYHSHMRVVIAVADNSSRELLNRTEQVASRLKKVDVIRVSPADVARPGRVWNRMALIAATPYVLVGRGLTHLNSYARLERQVYAISRSTNVVVAGGAFRNLTGHWKVGCYQSEIRNYYLRYLEGYRYSDRDCMYCDHLEGPFVAKTSSLTENPLHGELSDDVVFEDWFLRVKNSDQLAMSCPDAMYFVHGADQRKVSSSQERQQRRQDSWLSLAREWQIHRVFLPPNIIYLFSCKEVGLSCSPSKWVRGFLLPSCCLVQVARTFKALDDFASERGLRYEINSGSLLGAVKLRSFMPWDIDGDVTFEQRDYATFHKKRHWLRGRGVKLDGFRPPTAKSPAYFKMRTPEVDVDMIGSDTMSTVFLPADVREMPTRVNVLGLWLRGQANPGLYARNRYGPNYLKHSQSWRTLGLKDSWAEYRNAGSWTPCPKEYHHACLDHYPVDGNIDFVPQAVH
ncbi:hypothetical protein PR048_024036 [Dryococelus australis]|uniref:LicD/FKTN/FKRP nucleotidyltransferase domain-containing protein n=1 Tax=Dryococelus australis TaxID=614101 RepID=A0ABQ9GVU2_9NEOP|nr:hypothetical protein PR048_024036 [Dryococelus australis]